MSKQKNSKEPIQAIRGMHDILPETLPYYDKAVREARRVAEYYGFQTIRTPHVEPRELFEATLGETSEIVEKQMYAFRTRGGDAVVLRPEGTASVMRAYFQHGMDKNLSKPQKFFYSGSFFRHESPQAGRTREFIQAGVEIIGDSDPVNDALVIRILVSALEAMHIRNVIVHVNSIGEKESRTAFMKEFNNFLKRRQNSLCKDCKRRMKDNPMRILDCKEEECVQVRTEAPHIVDYLSERAKKHFQEVLEFLDEMKIPYRLDPYLVRGLDYYTDTVFEIFVEGVAAPEVAPAPEEKEVAPVEVPEGEAAPVEILDVDKPERGPAPIAPEAPSTPIAIAAGGRYDMLAHALYGKVTPAVGGALGIDRIVGELMRRGLKVRPEITPKVFLIQLGPLAKKRVLNIAEDLRKSGIPFSHMLTRDDLRQQLKMADKLGTPLALIIGQKEAVEERAILRQMNTGAQETVPFAKIVSTIKMRLKGL